jgi:HSP20 family protein
MFYRRFFGFPAMEARNPFSELERMRRQLERVFEGPAMARRDLAGVFPLINLTENKDSFFIRAELPGLKPEDLDIQATANSVSISGERKIPTEDKNARYHRREREAGRFSRVVGLPSEINSGKVDASLVNGVLTVVVPKAEMAKPRQISVK